MKHTSLNTPTERAAWQMFALAILLAGSPIQKESKWALKI